MHAREGARAQHTRVRAGDIPVDTECHINEGTNPTMNAHSVGVANIFARNGRMGATVVVFDPATKQEDEHRAAFVGEEIAIGSQRYRIVVIDEGKGDTRATITLRRVP